MTPTLEQIRHRLRERNLRCTRQREVVYGALASTTAHPTAEELYAMVRHEDEGASLATIYNTLEALTRVGLASRIPSASAGGPCRYDACTGAHVHVQLTDGRVMDVPETLGERLMDRLPADVLDAIEAAMGISIVGIRLTIEGEAR